MSAAAHGHDHGLHGHEHAHEHAVAPAVPARVAPTAHEHGGTDHGHSHGGVDAGILSSRAAMRTLALSLAVLGVTAAVQVLVVVLSHSVALLADAVHNVGDALTAVPLAVAFMLLRRPPTKRFTYGYGRAEDFAGIIVVLIILFSSVYAAYAAIERLLHPSPPGYLTATAIAGVVGFVGNEWVAIYRIRSGKRIGSAALVADGYHARIDGLTSLAVVVGAIGVALGFDLADPLIGLLISLAIFRIVLQALRSIGLRAMDGVEDGTIDEIRDAACTIDGVERVVDVRARWVGHVVRAELVVAVPGELSVRSTSDLVDAVRRRVCHGVDHVDQVAVELLPGEAV